MLVQLKEDKKERKKSKKTQQQRQQPSNSPQPKKQRTKKQRAEEEEEEEEDDDDEFDRSVADLVSEGKEDVQIWVKVVSLSPSLLSSFFFFLSHPFCN